MIKQEEQMIISARWLACIVHANILSFKHSKVNIEYSDYLEVHFRNSVEILNVNLKLRARIHNTSIVTKCINTIHPGMALQTYHTLLEQQSLHCYAFHCP